jgi:hypothetical protein
VPERRAKPLAGGSKVRSRNRFRPCHGPILSTVEACSRCA